MDGLGLIRLVRDRWPTVGLVVASGKSIIAEADLPSGARLFPKPYRTFQIESALRHLIADLPGSDGAETSASPGS
jgi:hypothetical protein